MKRILLLSAFVLIFVQVSAQTGTWSGNIELSGAKLSLVFHLDESGNATLDVPDQGAKGIQATVKREVAGKIKIEIAAIAASFEGLWMLNTITGTFTQRGLEFPLSLKPGEPVRNRPQTPVGPFPYTTEDVSFNNGGACLKGTLTMPSNADRKTLALIMISGSGLQNRDEELFDHKPFAVIADALARVGVATLRYDDRGFGESTGDIVNFTEDDLKNDALAGIKLLRERFDAVGVLGHSEGGSLALLLASEGAVEFVVSLAAMVVSPSRTLLDQNEYALISAGIDEGVRKEYLRLLSDYFKHIVEGAPKPDASLYGISDALAQNFKAVQTQFNTPYMRSFISLDVQSALGKIQCPVLALNGTKDSQVDCAQNLSALEKGLKSPNKLAPIKNANHLFQHCDTGDVSEYKDIEETISPEVLETIVDWLKTEKSIRK